MSAIRVAGFCILHCLLEGELSDSLYSITGSFAHVCFLSNFSISISIALFNMFLHPALFAINGVNVPELGLFVLVQLYLESMIHVWCNLESGPCDMR